MGWRGRSEHPPNVKQCMKQGDLQTELIGPIDQSIPKVCLSAEMLKQIIEVEKVT